MNSKVRLVKIGVYCKYTRVFNLACFQSGLHRPLLASIYRWPGLEDRVESDTDSISIYGKNSYLDYHYNWA
jgi:hypothetical protein